MVYSMPTIKPIKYDSFQNSEQIMLKVGTKLVYYVLARDHLKTSNETARAVKLK